MNPQECFAFEGDSSLCFRPQLFSALWLTVTLTGGILMKEKGIISEGFLSPWRVISTELDMSLLQTTQWVEKEGESPLGAVHWGEDRVGDAVINCDKLSHTPPGNSSVTYVPEAAMVWYRDSMLGWQKAPWMVHCGLKQTSRAKLN